MNRCSSRPLISCVRNVVTEFCDRFWMSLQGFEDIFVSTFVYNATFMGLTHQNPIGPSQIPLVCHSAVFDGDRKSFEEEGRRIVTYVGY
jgi:hypothetical protein